MTMKTIHVDEGVYAHLLNNTLFIGEDASSILRRMLGLSGAKVSGAGKQAQEDSGPTTSSRPQQSAAFRGRNRGNATENFLQTLAELAAENRDRFHDVLQIRGRRRLYFTRSRETLEASGRSVKPVQIPGTGFWVVTNNDTPKKKRILKDVLEVLEVPRIDHAAWMGRI